MKTVNATEIVEFYNSINLYQKEHLMMLLINDLTIAVEKNKGMVVMFKPQIDKISINGTEIQIFLSDEEN